MKNAIGGALLALGLMLFLHGTAVYNAATRAASYRSPADDVFLGFELLGGCLAVLGGGMAFHKRD